MMSKKDPANRGPTQMADVFSRHSRRKVEQLFGTVFDNEDYRTYRLAQSVLRDEQLWMEEGMVRYGER
jgi:hypothetical protein